MGSLCDYEGCITHGPWGGSQGHKWVYMPLPLGFIKKIKIMVRYDVFVESIKFETDGSNGETKSSIFGCPDGNQTKTICIDYPNEYLMAISGKVGRHDGSVVVMSICFMTNLKLYGPYGTDSGTVFSYDVKDGVIAGFHGRVDEYLTAIGVYVIPKTLASLTNPIRERKIMNELCSSMSRMAMPRDAGPWGTGGGKPWDDGVFSAIKQIRVHLGEVNVIYGIQFEYLKSDGKSVLSQLHGGTYGSEIVPVDLDVKDEFLIGISGFYGPVEEENLEAIVSITFHTNVQVYGPYGEEKGAGYVYFSSTSPGKVVGFQGKDNGFLSAIGVHMEYDF